MLNVSSRHKPPGKVRQTTPHLKEESSFFNFSIVKKIGSAKFRVYLVVNKTDQKKYALKAYPYTEEGINERYRRESRFSKFSHPNICNIVHSIPEKLAVQNAGVEKFSFLMLEYAPHGDFYELFKKKQAMLSEQLARTYFHQLIEGLDYLHQNNVAHLDIKCENLLIDENFKMKITDFDLSQYLSDEKIESRGTLCYRAPEVIAITCKDLAKADIYSAGIMLFILRSGGIPPHLENEEYQGINLYNLLYENLPRFWEVHQSFQDTDNYYSDDFKALFNAMVEKDPSKRITLDKIKRSEWYTKPILTDEQLKTEMKYFYLA